MGKIGFINDVTRGIKKVMDIHKPEAPTVVKEVIKETVTREPSAVIGNAPVSVQEAPRSDNDRRASLYIDAKEAMSKAQTASDFEKAAEAFKSIAGYSNSEALAAKCSVKAKDARRKAVNETDFADRRRKNKKIFVILSFVLLISVTAVNLYFVAMSMKSERFLQWGSLWPAWISSSVLFAIICVLSRKGLIFFKSTKSAIDGAGSFILIELLLMLITETVVSYMFYFTGVGILRVLGGIARGIVGYIAPSVVAFFCIGCADPN